MRIATILLGSAMLLAGCKKYLQIPGPVDQLNQQVVFQNDATAEEAVLGIYHEMMNNPSQFTNGFTTLYGGMTADELYYYTPGVQDEFVQNQITIRSHPLISAGLWAPAYKYIYTANVCLEHLAASPTLTPSVQSRLLGECYFIRSFCYFYLVNFFGDVPLTDTTDYAINAHLPRTSATKIYEQMISDLRRAEQLLPVDYPKGEKTRPNMWAATALLARVLLYLGQYAEAEQQAASVINSAAYSLDSNLNQVFQMNSAEAIWQLQPVFPGYNSYEGYEILPATPDETPKYLLTPNLLNAFEPGDLRKDAWVASRLYNGQLLYYPYKYKVYGNNAPLTEYYMVLRLAELYLIRAEARARQNDLPGAVEDINILRARAGLGATTATAQNEVLSAIEQERRIELFCEWGHRWLDLKRTNRASAVLRLLKPATWQSSDTLWPIPIDQLHANPNLTQNPGY